MLVRLKIVILRRGISQAKLAQAIGRTPAHVSRLIRGRVRPRTRDRRRIARFLGIAEAKIFPLSSNRKRESSPYRPGPAK
jgi:transcriptional regulator with XRE-family HTH domain